MAASMMHAAVAAVGGYVGFDTVSRQIEKKFLQRGFHFNLMVVGETGLGKSTFINTLFASHLAESKAPFSAAEPPRQTTEIHTSNFAIDENGVKMKLTLIDTPGMGDLINNDYCWDPILRYIKDQYAQYLRKELSPTRDKRIVDTRVHCVIYFIAPTGHALKPLDVVVMKKLGELCNLIPVIAKSDMLTMEERAEFKKRVKEEIQFHGISVFPHVGGDADVDSEDFAMDESIRKIIPFAIVGSENTMQLQDGKVVRVRKNKCGVVNVEDPLHCEFVHLRNFMIRTHMHSLIESTDMVHYEHFRTRQLLALKEASKSG